MQAHKINVFWFRRDLRFNDNAGLFRALSASLPVLPLFIFDTNILDQLPERYDRRVHFIHQVLQDMQAQLRPSGKSILFRTGKPGAVFTRLCKEYSIQAVYTNRDYEPYARQRDQRIKDLLGGRNIDFVTVKDQVIFEEKEVLKADGTPYTVFTPYSRKWKEHLAAEKMAFNQSEALLHNLLDLKDNLPALEELNFKSTDIIFKRPEAPFSLPHSYAEARNIPSVNGTSGLSMHLRFGTISIRRLVQQARQTDEVFLNELIWREFYMIILYHFPSVVSDSFKKEYDHIAWRNNEKEFTLWCEGRTGYPLVDAGMRQLKETGYMHNRVRMVTASFLTKHLLIDWRWGEAYFAFKLNDYELSSNNGGWQWAAGSGCDAAPYFRIFNPEEQQKKFDPEFKYIRKWVPEFGTPLYPAPIVEHKFARERALTAYKKALRG